MTTRKRKITALRMWRTPDGLVLFRKPLIPQHVPVYVIDATDPQALVEQDAKWDYEYGLIKTRQVAWEHIPEWVKDRHREKSRERFRSLGIKLARKAAR